ncbi:MAG TPA: primosomal protein N' [Steroidobacteraceae bacterium]|nr:primosomal protein N' [Steroidobacteraceae bacterium]
MTASLLAVAIDAPLRRLFDYRLPPGVDPASIRLGQRVWVPFGRRKAVGVVVECRERSALPETKLRSALALIDDEPVVDPVLLDLLRWAAEYYRHPIGEVLAAALPVALRGGADALQTSERWVLSVAARTGALAPLGSRASKLREMAAWLEAHEPAGAAELAAVSPRWREHLRELEKRGWVTRTLEASAGPAAAGAHDAPVVTGPVLTPEQQTAVQAIAAAHGGFASFVLHGVTGSGKTEVYLRAIAEVVARGEQALVLVPEISLTPQLVSRFAARFPGPLAVLHSGLADGERLQAWRAARAGLSPVVIGTRSAVFAPLAKPGLVVVDEEHDASYKQQEGFRYSARDLALARAQRLGVPVVLGSATPSLESLERARSGKARLLRLPNRTAGAKPPVLQLVDLRAHAATQGIATPAVLAIQRHLAANGQVLVYLNRRGYAPTLFCPGCGWVAPCPRCDARLTVHRRERSLECHHCGTHRAAPEACPSCGEPVKPVGQGTERIEETLAAMFPDVPLVRIDRDAMRRRGALEQTLQRVQSGEVRLLVGTQMLTKGHHFPDVTLVVVLNADQGLFGTDFRAAERLAQTIVQVAGRAGRAERPGEVLIQTEYPSHPLLQQLVAGGYDAFSAAALVEREQAGWPPFARVAVLRAEAAGRETPLAFLEHARELAEQCRGQDAVELLGPATAPMERRAGHFRAQLLLHAATHSPLQRVLARWVPLLEETPTARKVRWALDVDPLELF